MKKMKYIQPQASILLVTGECILEASNTISADGSSADLNPETMGNGNGSDAASRRHAITVWEDEDTFEDMEDEF